MRQIVKKNVRGTTEQKRGTKDFKNNGEKMINIFKHYLILFVIVVFLPICTTSEAVEIVNSSEVVPNNYTESLVPFPSEGQRRIMKKNRTIKSYTMNLAARADEIFPLLCPIREYEWIQPWQCEMVYTDSGRAELDCVFKTNFPDDGPEDTWVVSRYEPPNYIEFVRINPIRSIRYCIELIQQEDASTQAIWKQVITGLNSEGDDLVAGFTDEAYFREMKILQNMISHFLKTGEMLKILE